MATLIDSLTNLITPAVGQIAGKLGESEMAVSSGVTGSLGSLLGGLLHKSKDTAAFGQIFDVIGSAPPSANLAGDVQAAGGAVGTSAGAATDSATNFLGMLFGGQTSAVTDLLGRTAGFKNPTSAPALFRFAVPMVINFLGQKIHEGGLDASGLSKLLTSERDSIGAAAPPGFMNVLESAPQTPHVERELPPDRDTRRPSLRRRHAHRAQRPVALARRRRHGRSPAVDRRLGVAATSGRRKDEPERFGDGHDAESRRRSDRYVRRRGEPDDQRARCARQASLAERHRDRRAGVRHGAESDRVHRRVATRGDAQFVRPRSADLRPWLGAAPARIARAAQHDRLDPERVSQRDREDRRLW